MDDHGQYILNIGDEFEEGAKTERFHTIEELQSRLRELEKGPPIRFDALRDLGPQESWFYRLFGVKRKLLWLFAAEWYDRYVR
ncbi:MAG: hypothetical protein ACRD4D_02640, partial [Candidatus Acidiferrales bacterium]